MGATGAVEEVRQEDMRWNSSTLSAVKLISASNICRMIMEEICDSCVSISHLLYPSLLLPLPHIVKVSLDLIPEHCEQ